jgi:hypothetical protein
MIEEEERDSTYGNQKRRDCKKNYVSLVNSAERKHLVISGLYQNPHHQRYISA